MCVRKMGVLGRKWCFPPLPTTLKHCRTCCVLIQESFLTHRVMRVCVHCSLNLQDLNEKCMKAANSILLLGPLFARHELDGEEVQWIDWAIDAESRGFHVLRTLVRYHHDALFDKALQRFYELRYVLCPVLDIRLCSRMRYPTNFE